MWAFKTVLDISCYYRNTYKSNNPILNAPNKNIGGICVQSESKIYSLRNKALTAQRLLLFPFKHYSGEAISLTYAFILNLLQSIQ